MREAMKDLEAFTIWGRLLFVLVHKFFCGSPDRLGHRDGRRCPPLQTLTSLHEGLRISAWGFPSDL